MRRVRVKSCSSVDFVSAILVVKGIFHLTNKSFVTKEDADRFVSSCLHEFEVDHLWTSLLEVQIPRLIEFLTGKWDRETFISLNANRSAASRLAEVFGNPSLLNKIELAYQHFRPALEKAFAVAEKLHVESRYQESEIFHNINKWLNIVVIPLLFMSSAPLGRHGFYDDTSCTITLLFGAVNQEAPRFQEWYRFGVWHLAASLLVKKNIRETVPADFPSDFIDSGFLNQNYNIHKNMQSYVSSHIVNAAKLIAENSVNKSQSLDQMVKEPYSKGLYHINWFIDNMKGIVLDDKAEIAHLIEKWFEKLKEPIERPRFIGPLEACYYPHWLKEIRLVFGPSISPRTRAKLRSVNQKVLKKPFTECDLSDAWTGGTDYKDYNNFFFLTRQDHEWIEKIMAYFKIDPDGHIHDRSSFVFAVRHLDRPELFSKVCVALREEDLLALNRQGKSYDWFALDNGIMKSGEILYTADTCRFVEAGRSEDERP